MVKVLGFDVGIRNLSYCLIEKVGKNYTQILKWGNIDLLKDSEVTMANKISPTVLIHMLQLAMQNNFPAEFVRKNVDSVFIELQPGGRFSNPKPILCSHLLYQYFYNILFNVKRGDILQTVQFVSGSLKFQKRWLDLIGATKEKNYKKRKMLSCSLCKELLLSVKNTTSVTMENQLKPDDLADAFLIAMVHIY
jgi:Holliday junction resolvasome RuvABC endonuclease subunit